jgi:hypothetical protein
MNKPHPSPPLDKGREKGGVFKLKKRRFCFIVNENPSLLHF